ncbi:MAG: hypothetical protein ACXAB4_09600, partial [Candidatus Hodarchaeales archaeon]
MKSNEQTVILQEKFGSLFDNDKETFPEEDEVAKMETSVLGASSLDTLKAGRWGDMTRYLAKKIIADLSMAKRAAHTIQVVDVETLMRQFDAAIQRLDSLVRKAPNGERITLKRIADEIDQMKKDLYDDFYSSVERLQKESSYLSLIKHYPMDGGKPTFTGKITVPALCGVLANILEGIPTSARVKRAFIMEMLLKSLPFLDEIDELCQGSNLREILRLALHAEQAGNIPRGLRSLASKLILHSKYSTENHLLFVDLRMAHWTINFKNRIDWSRVDFSAQQMYRVAASEFADPLIEVIRKRLRIRTVLAESGIDEGRRLKASANDSAIGIDQINKILEDTGSLVDGTRDAKNAEKAIEATLWCSLYVWYKKISVNPNSSVKGLQISGDGGGNIRVWEHAFLDTDILQSVREGKQYAKYYLQEKAEEFANSIAMLGNEYASYKKLSIDFRKLFPPTEAFAKRFEKPMAWRLKAERLYGFTRAWKEYWGPSFPRRDNILIARRLQAKPSSTGKGLYDTSPPRPIRGRGVVYPTDDAMREILDSLGYIREKIKRAPTAKFRSTETQIIEDAILDKRVAFRVRARELKINLAGVQEDVTEARVNGKTFSSIFVDHLKITATNKGTFGPKKGELIAETLDSMKYWHKRLGLDFVPLDDEDFYLFFANMAMCHGLSKNLSSSTDAAAVLARILDDPDFIKLDHYTISNMLPGSMRSLLDHVEIYLNPKSNNLVLTAIQDKVAKAGESFDGGRIAKDLHVLKNYVEGLFNQIQSARTGKRWGGKKGVFFNLTPEDELKMAKLRELVRESKINAEIFG